jgi:hypothetical protein
MLSNKKEYDMHTLSFDKSDDVPAELQSFVKEAEDGKFTVTLVPQQKLTEFRDTNTNVVRERDTYKGVLSKLAPVIGEDYANIDNLLAELPELRTIKQQVDDGKLQGSTEIQKEVEQRIGAMKEEHQNALQHLQSLYEQEKGERGKAENKYKQTLIDRQVTEAVLKDGSGARKDALGMFLREAYETFKVDEHGGVVPYDREGKIVYGSDGATPMSASEWLKHQAEKLPFLFEQSSGGGAGGGAGTNRGIDMNLPPEERLRLARTGR